MAYLTRFRAYQLDSAGSLFSYFKPGQFTLIEARIPKGGIEILNQEMEACGVQSIDTLHITSWDTDHVNFDDLTTILNELRPGRIEAPAYKPESDEGKLCKRVLDGYDEVHSKYVKNVQYYTKEWIDSLSPGTAKGTNDIVYKSDFDGDNKNDKSLIKLLRSSGFNVASFGDCESQTISDALVFSGSFMCNEMDIMILAHHGANNGFTNEEFLKKTRPTLTICSSNYDNQYEHPKKEIKELLHELDIPIFTTKTGDVIVYQESGQAKAIIHNLISDNTKESSKYQFTPKRFRT
ncbi:MAG: hypothetical protein DYG99_12140 [Bacteroidetes bacterium CHB5]|nr:hypothetical protein [Bacteroidetes bacterium CHB5]